MGLGGYPAAPLAAAVALVLLGCGGGDGSAADSAAPADTVAAAAPAPGDSGTAALPGRAPSQNADHEFLRAMSDHHEALVTMAATASTAASDPDTQSDAAELHIEQEAERKELVRMIADDFGESFTPAVVPQYRAMVDSLQGKQGVEYDHTFYRNAIRHHRDGIALIDRFLPRLMDDDVRMVAERIRRTMEAEIVGFQERLGKLGSG